jgi:hypothetical protein
MVFAFMNSLITMRLRVHMDDLSDSTAAQQLTLD